MDSVKTWLKDNKISQRQFAADLDVHETAVSQWLALTTKPSLTNLQKIAKRTGISVDLLLAELNRAA